MEYCTPDRARGKAVEDSLGSREVVDAHDPGTGLQHFEHAVERLCWVSIGTRDVPSRPTSLTSGGLGGQVTKALKLEGLLCTERLVVRATSAP